MKRTYKNIYSLVLAAGVMLGMASCGDEFLDQRPSDGVLENEAIKSRGDDSGTFDLKNEIFANYQITKSSLEKELIRTKQLYSKAASITLENGLLRCFFTQRKSDSFSSQAESESIDIAGNRLYLRKVMVRVPDRFLESDPREDLLFAVWILKILRQNNYLISGIISEEVATGYPEVYYL